MPRNFSLLFGVGRRGPREGGALPRHGVLRSELREVGAERARQLPADEARGELVGGRDAGVIGRARAVLARDEPRQDGALRHLQALRHGRDARERRRQARHVRLHVGQQLLQLVQHLVQDRVGRLVACQALLRQVLVRFSQAFHLK